MTATTTTFVTAADFDRRTGADPVRTLIDVASWMDAMLDPPGEENVSVDNTGGGIFCIIVQPPFEVVGEAAYAMIDVALEAMGVGQHVTWRIGVYDGENSDPLPIYGEELHEFEATGPIEEVARRLVAEVEAAFVQTVEPDAVETIAGRLHRLIEAASDDDVAPGFDVELVRRELIRPDEGVYDLGGLADYAMTPEEIDSDIADELARAAFVRLLYWDDGPTHPGPITVTPDEFQAIRDGEADCPACEADWPSPCPVCGRTDEPMAPVEGSGLGPAHSTSDQFRIGHTTWVTVRVDVPVRTTGDPDPEQVIAQIARLVRAVYPDAEVA